MPYLSSLGVWNIFANRDFPAPQIALMTLLCGSSATAACPPDQLLPTTSALFKTPSLRDLGHSDPYFHSGGAAKLEDVLAHYSRASRIARAHKLRNGAPELEAMRLDHASSKYLVAFLKALNEDYH